MLSKSCGIYCRDCVRNGRFSTFGHLPLESHMEFIDSSSLVEFSQIEPSVGEPHEPCWKKPISCECNTIYHGLIWQRAHDLPGQYKGSFLQDAQWVYDKLHDCFDREKIGSCRSGMLMAPV
ncbi:hypothetical protein RRG08_065781 [Elysia crispata]|uniref:Uncharacterized protein n=1 Tax=Elysia crispata TaxID=231223 RepID=A0AAE1DLD9_9GAST|nr:hypothetical protein RRG08_065781 [Elysia crispata]